MIRIGMVGAGGIARSHADAIKSNPDCSLVCIADINLEKAEQIARDHGAHVFSDYKNFDCASMDAVILNLPHYLHREASIYFLERGLGVLCEKPMACTVEECDEMIAAAEKSGARLAIGHVQKYYTALERVREIIEEKRFGALVMIHETRTKDYVPGRPAWFLSKQMAGGGIAMNLGAHSLDRILYTTGLEVEEIYGITANPITDHDVETAAQFLLKLSGGVSASVTLCGTHIPATHESIYYFTDGVLKVVGEELWIYENGKFVSYGGTRDLFGRQLTEFLKLLRGEESAVSAPEYGREIIRLLKKII